MAEKPVKEVVEELLERVTKLENQESGGDNKEWRSAYSGSVSVSGNSTNGILDRNLTNYRDEVKDGAPFIINYTPAAIGVACCGGINISLGQLNISCVNTTSSTILINIEVLVYC